MEDNKIQKYDVYVVSEEWNIKNIFGYYVEEINAYKNCGKWYEIYKCPTSNFIPRYQKSKKTDPRYKDITFLEKIK